MGKFDNLAGDIWDGVKNAADVAGKTTNKAVNYSKLKYRIRQLRGEMKNVYANLGELVYMDKENYRNENVDTHVVFDMYAEKIDNLNDEIVLLKEQLRAYKKSNECKNCGKTYAKNDMYCAGCGEKLERENETENNAQTDNSLDIIENIDTEEDATAE